MLEADAKNKLCPMAMSDFALDKFEGGLMNCQGSNCMAWEWFADTYEEDGVPGVVLSRIPRGRNPNGYTKLPPHGACGIKSKGHIEVSNSY